MSYEIKLRVPTRRVWSGEESIFDIIIKKDDITFYHPIAYSDEMCDNVKRLSEIVRSGPHESEDDPDGYFSFNSIPGEDYLMAIINEGDGDYIRFENLTNGRKQNLLFININNTNKENIADELLKLSQDLHNNRNDRESLLIQRTNLLDEIDTMQERLMDIDNMLNLRNE